MSDWIRVNRANRCPQCNSDTWCTYNNDVLLCMRTESDRPHTLKSGEVGWIHMLTDRSSNTFVRREKEPEVTINAGKLMAEFQACRPDRLLPSLAKDLGVSPRSLYDLGCAWAPPHKSYAFPMFDGYGNTVGIRLRALDGRKWAVRGSRQGIFCPSVNGQKRAVVCEGPTCTAAALTLGFYAVGRPHCSGGMEPIKALFKRHGIREAVIISDNDEPGINGAIMLRNQLPIPTAIITLPTKDVREFLVRGGTKEDIEELVSNVLWHQPKVH